MCEYEVVIESSILFDIKVATWYCGLALGEDGVNLSQPYFIRLDTLLISPPFIVVDHLKGELRGIHEHGCLMRD